MTPAEPGSQAVGGLASVARVSTAYLNPTEMRKIAQAVLSEVIEGSIPTYDAPDFFSQKKTPKKAREASDEGLKISKIKTAGDVLHIFSHIRKTYRVQWVLLEGSDGNSEDSEVPPKVIANYEFPAATDAANGDGVDKKTKGKKGKKAADAKSMTANAEPVLRWVPYEDVAHAK